MEIYSIFKEEMFDPWLFGGFGHFHVSWPPLKLQALNIAGRHLGSAVQGSPSPITELQETAWVSHKMVKHLAYKGCLKFPDLSPKLPLQIVKENAFQKTENRQESEVDTTPQVMNINELLHPRNLTWRYQSCFGKGHSIADPGSYSVEMRDRELVNGRFAMSLGAWTSWGEAERMRGRRISIEIGKDQNGWGEYINVVCSLKLEIGEVVSEFGNIWRFGVRA